MSIKKDLIITKEELIQNPTKDWRPHVVLLGAGASRAAFPAGDANSKRVPLMNDLIRTLNLYPYLGDLDTKIETNFEEIYSNLLDESNKHKIEEQLYQYFLELALPDTATHYDRLLLSLRSKDAILTFNWDPFLFDAYDRNNGVACLPSIYFLHGNVRIGACLNGHKWGRRGICCPRCNKPFTDVPLIYPIKKKNYSKSPFIKSHWECAQQLFANAFTITIFGYSAPSSDVVAVKLLRKAWKSQSKREIDHVEVIDINTDPVYKRWEKFTTAHLQSTKTFERSRLWRWPRRSCESLIYPTTQGKLCEDFPLPSTEDLNELQTYIANIAKFESS